MILNIFEMTLLKVRETCVEMYTAKSYCKNLWQYLRTNNVVCCPIRSKYLTAYVDIYVAREERILVPGVMQTAWNPSESITIFERKDRAAQLLRTIYSLMVKQLAGHRRDVTERNLSRRRDTLPNDSKHWSKPQFTDRMQNRLKANYAPWRGLSYDSVSIPRLSSAVRSRMNEWWIVKDLITGIWSLSPLLGVKIIHLLERTDLFKISNLVYGGSNIVTSLYIVVYMDRDSLWGV